MLDELNKTIELLEATSLFGSSSVEHINNVAELLDGKRIVTDGSNATLAQTYITFLAIRKILNVKRS